MAFGHVRTGPRRRHLAAGVGVAAVGLSVTSVAFACTTFLGQGVMKGDARDATTGQKEKVTVVGNARGMSYCNPAPLGDLAPGSGHTFVRGNDEENRVSLTLSPTTDCTDTSGTFHWGGQLPDGAYNVNFQQGPAYTNSSDDSRTWLLDCMYNTEQGASNTATKVGVINVVAGSANGGFNLGTTLVPSGPDDEAAVCISNLAGQFTDTNGKVANAGRGAFGLQIPVTVL